MTDRISSSKNQLAALFSKPNVKKAFCILEKVSLIALAIFAAYVSPKLFFPFFAGGVVLGAYQNWNKRIIWPWQGAKKEECHGGKECHKEAEQGGCSQGFLEQLTGVKLPAPLALAANLAITACHIDHHATVFVPIIGFNFGMCAGSLLGDVLPRMWEKTHSLDSAELKDVLVN